MGTQHRQLETTQSAQLDQLFDGLADRRRRYALAVLHEHDAPLALADLADEVATGWDGRRFADGSTGDVEQVYASLYHMHIPKLVEAGLVEYDASQDTVAATERVETREEFWSRVLPDT